jgi:polysaccharide export outer membrane protein
VPSLRHARTCLPPDQPPGEVINQGLQDDRIRYDVVDVSSGVVDALLAQPAESFRTRFGKYYRPPPPEIGIADTVSVSIWEAPGGRLFRAAPIARVSTGSRSVTIPEQVVGADGGISVPFAGRVPVAGRSIVDVQHEIKQRLAQKAIAAGDCDDHQERNLCCDSLR